MKREARIQSVKATRWVERYAGNNIIKGYSKWFAVDPLCAIIELRMLGVAIAKAHEDQSKASLAVRASVSRQRKEALTHTDFEPSNEDMDYRFAFIAGHTSGGAPFGITWEEIGEDPPWLKHESYESSQPTNRPIVAKGAGDQNRE